MLLRGVIVVYVICSSSSIVCCQESPESLRNHGYPDNGKHFELSGLEDSPSIVVFINRDNPDNLTELEDQSYLNPYLYLDQYQSDDDFDNPNRRHESYSGMYHFSFDLQPSLKLQNSQQVLNNYKIPSNNIIGYSIKLQHPDKTNKYGHELQKFYSIFNGKSNEDENPQTVNTFSNDRENKFELSDEQRFLNQFITLKNLNDESAFKNAQKNNANAQSIPSRPIVTFLNPNYVHTYAEHPQIQAGSNEYTSESENYASVANGLKQSYEEESKSNSYEEKAQNSLPLYAVFPFRYANNVQPTAPEPTEVQTENTDVDVEGSYKSEEKIKTITFTEKVPYPIKIEKKVPVPVKIPVDKPYPVFISRPVPVRIHKPVPVPVKVPVPKPYPVQKLVPVPFKVPVPRSFPVPVIKPYPVYVVKRVPFAVIKPRLYPVKVPVEKPVPYAVTYNKYVPVPVYKDVPVPVKLQYQEDYKEYGEGEEHSEKDSGSVDQNSNEYTYSTTLNGIKLPIHIPLDKVKEEPEYVVNDYSDKDVTYSTDSFSNEDSSEDTSSQTYGMKQIIYHTVHSDDNQFIEDSDKEAKFEEEVKQNNKPLSFQKIVYKSKNPSSLIHHGSYRIKHPKSMHSMNDNKQYTDKDYSLSYHTPFKEEESSEFIDIRDVQNEVKPVKEDQMDVSPESYLDILKINGEKSEPSMKTHVISINHIDKVESKQIRNEIQVKKKEIQRIRLKEVNKINEFSKDTNKINNTAIDAKPKSSVNKQTKTVYRGSKKYSKTDDSEGEYTDNEESFKTDEADSFGQKYQREMTKKEDGVGTQRDEASGARKQRSSGHRVT